MNQKANFNNGFRWVYNTLLCTNKFNMGKMELVNRRMGWRRQRPARTGWRNFFVQKPILTKNFGQEKSF